MLKQRESNIELLRIVAMMMIMLLHTDFSVFGWPNQQKLMLNHEIWNIRIFIEQFCVVGVNVFIAISGWFGIQYTHKGILKILFQIFLLSSIVLSIVLIFHLDSSLNLHKIFYSYCSWWFVWSYLILFILSPILNSFIEHTSQKVYRNVLIAFFTLQTIAVFIEKAPELNYGYSAISFIGIYLLVRYYKKYIFETKEWKNSTLLWITAMIAFALPLLTIFSGYINPQLLKGLLHFQLNYAYPLNVLQALLLVILFSRIRLQSKIINALAASSFSVYLLHQNILISKFYSDIVETIWYKKPMLVSLSLTLAFIIVVYLICFIIDQLRIYSWKYCQGFLNR